jgi:GTP1/Obg family GTP-binding protein
MVPAIALGSISVLTAIMSTVLSYYKFSAKAEAHRMSAQLYLKIYKKIEVELSLPYTQRTDPLKLLEEVREKLARVSEVAPDVPEIVIAKYKSNFSKGDTKAPIIANGLDKIVVYREEEEKQTPKMIRIKSIV